MKRDEKSPPPLAARVVVTGEFNISEAFPSEKISLWIGTNAAFVLYPYLRERMHYITAQGGYPPIMLPLLQIPTMKIEGGKFGVPAKSVPKLGVGAPQEKSALSARSFGCGRFRAFGEEGTDWRTSC